MANFTRMQASDELVYAEKGADRHAAKCPIVDAIRGHLIANDGMFCTALDGGGSIAGNARWGWAAFERKPLLKALQRANGLRQGVFVASNGSLVEGYLVSLHADDARAFGVELCEVGGELGVLVLSADALALTLTGKQPTTGATTERDRNPVTATPLAKGLELLRQGSKVSVAARAATRNSPAMAAFTVYGFPKESQVTLDAGHTVEKAVAQVADVYGNTGLEIDEASLATVAQAAPARSFGRNAFTDRRRFGR